MTTDNAKQRPQHDWGAMHWSDSDAWPTHRFTPTLETKTRTAWEVATYEGDRDPWHAARNLRPRPRIEEGGRQHSSWSSGHIVRLGLHDQCDCVFWRTPRATT